MGALLLVVVLCLVVPPAAVLAFGIAGGALATMGVFAIGFAGAVATAVGLLLLPAALSHLKVHAPADLR